MKYVDFTKKRMELHKEIENAIKDLMKGKEVKEIDLTTDEDTYDTGWIVRCFYGESTVEEVQVAAIKLDGNTLLYKGKNTWITDSDWLPFDVSDNVIAGTIDTVYDAVFQRI